MATQFTKHCVIFFALAIFVVFVWQSAVYQYIMENIALLKVQIANTTLSSKIAYTTVSTKTWLHNDHPWDMWEKMMRSRTLTEKSDVSVQKIVDEMMTAKIVLADVGYKGTTLKVQLTLDGPKKQQVVFKPKRYEITRTFKDTKSGSDRHNVEIAAYHLDRTLEFYRTPPVVGRILNLKTEILPVAKKSLRNTFFDKDGSMCFYGVCYDCKKSKALCARGIFMEGSLTLWVPHVTEKPHPWSRSYSSHKARWEVDDNYCTSVQKKSPYNKGPRLLDIMDAAIFDFLINNSDRHDYHYQSRKGIEGVVLLVDNGRGFANHSIDETGMLAPIYQCCQLRHSTYRKLKSFSTDSSNSSSISRILDTKLKKDPLYPILTELQLLALDRRLKIIFATLQTCFDTHGEKKVLKE